MGCSGANVAAVAFLVFLSSVVALLLAGCSTVVVGPSVYFSIASPASGAQARVYVAAESTTRGDQPIAMTVLDPVTGRALDTFPLSTSGARPCGVPAANPNDHSVSYVAIDDRYIPLRRWEEAVGGRGEPYRVRLYFRSDQGVIWEAEVMPRYSGCPTR